MAELNDQLYLLGRNVLTFNNLSPPFFPDGGVVGGMSEELPPSPPRLVRQRNILALLQQELEFTTQILERRPPLRRRSQDQ